MMEILQSSLTSPLERYHAKQIQKCKGFFPPSLSLYLFFVFPQSFSLPSSCNYRYVPLHPACKSLLYLNYALKRQQKATFQRTKTSGQAACPGIPLSGSVCCSDGALFWSPKVPSHPRIQVVSTLEYLLGNK